MPELPVRPLLSGPPPVEREGPRPEVTVGDRGKEVWLFRKTHLDLGFTDQPEIVVDRFVQVHFPRVITTAKQLAVAGEPPLVWTSGSWILWQALERSRGTEREALEMAVASGWLAWHALPFTTHSELLDRWLLEVGIGLAEELGARFGRRAISAKLTDVPGHTVGLVPALADAGVELLHIGVNPASTVPEVPRLFRWRAAGREVLVIYAPLYGAFQELAGGRAVDMWVTGDNVGPPSLAEERERRAGLAREHPDADLVPASLDPVATYLRSCRAELPVVDEEIGDTWLHGAAADPALLARYRALLRWQRRRSGDLRPVAADIAGRDGVGGAAVEPSAEGAVPPVLSATATTAGRALLVAAEHTFGLDTKSVFRPGEPFDQVAFIAERRAGRYRPLEESWEKKAYAVDQALAVLDAAGSGPAEAVTPLLAPTPDQSEGGLLRPGEERAGRRWRIRVDADGSLDVTLEGAGEDGRCRLRLGPYLYQRYSAADYDAYLASYVRAEASAEPWAVGDFAKPGLEALGLSFVERASVLSWAAAWRPAPEVRSGSTRASHEVELAARAVLTVPVSPEETLVPPARLAWSCEFFADGSISFVLFRHAKPATRLPEAEWWLWRPLEPSTIGLLYEKLGCWIPAHQVVRGGGRHLHGVDRAFAFDTGRRRSWLIEPLESPLVAPGRGRLLRPWAELPPPADGGSTCLANNVWGTNFRMWNEGSTCHRFLLRRGATPASDLG